MTAAAGATGGSSGKRGAGRLGGGVAADVPWDTTYLKGEKKG